MKKKLTLLVLGLLIFSDFLETFSQFCFKKTAIISANFTIYSFLDLFTFVITVFSSMYLWIALLSVLLTFIIWTTILSKIDLSMAVPLASFSYILIPIVSMIFLHEQVTLLRWIGIFFILTGVIFVSLSEKKEKNAE